MGEGVEETRSSLPSNPYLGQQSTALKLRNSYCRCGSNGWEVGGGRRAEEQDAFCSICDQDLQLVWETKEPFEAYFVLKYLPGAKRI